MKPETLFLICNNLVIPGWLLLIAAPKWKWTRRIINTFIIPFILGLIYLYLVVTEIGSAEGGFMTLREVEKLFQNQYILLAGWIHYLAFDLFVGTWEVQDARKSGISHFLVVPCLILTFLFGPIGLVLYLIIKWAVMKNFLSETVGWLNGLREFRRSVKISKSQKDSPSEVIVREDRDSRG